MTYLKIHQFVFKLSHEEDRYFLLMAVGIGDRYLSYFCLFVVFESHKDVYTRRIGCLSPSYLGTKGVYIEVDKVLD